MNTATKSGINAAKKFGDKYGKKIMDTTKKEGVKFIKFLFYFKEVLKLLEI